MYSGFGCDGFWGYAGVCVGLYRGLILVIYWLNTGYILVEWSFCLFCIKNYAIFCFK